MIYEFEKKIYKRTKPFQQKKERKNGFDISVPCMENFIDLLFGQSISGNSNKNGNELQMI